MGGQRSFKSLLSLRVLFSVFVLSITLLSGQRVLAQADQGAVTGVVTDSSGAVVPNAAVTLTNTDTSFALEAKTDQRGVYIFSPVKIGNYQVSVSASGFETTTQEHVHLDVQQRLEVNLQLKLGSATETVTVSTAPPLMQTEEGSTGQVIDTQAINNTPLNGRNWVFIAQLTAGVAPPTGSRGAGKGDFVANGQRSEQNNFILDGVDNNVNVVDFFNGASFAVRPPPDALAEFKVQTGSYSAEFGHSAGAVVNASIKSGTNNIHGDLWEYIRNDAFDIRQYFDGPNPVPKYRQNQFGATLGFPLWKNKLFFFGDVEANRIIFGEAHTGYSVPTALMRAGDFSELLNPALVSGNNPITLYEPNTSANGTTLLEYNGQQNVLAPNQIDPVAQNLLKLYPAPNVGVAGQTYNNFNDQTNAQDNTWQWDARMDWNISAKDQVFARHSYNHEQAAHPPPLGPILDGGGFGDTGSVISLAQNFAVSETHVFAPTLTNEFRFGYNYGHFGGLQDNANVNIAPTLGLGGIPYGPKNGGLPSVNISGLSSFGSPTFYVTDEYQNVYQILDNVNKVIGNHSMKGGVLFQRVRFSTEQPTQPRGTYNFTGVYTSKQGTAHTGFGAADFLTNNFNSSAVSNIFTSDDVRWNRSGYFQDDWKVSPDLTLNLGIRYEYYQPYYERHDHQASFTPTSAPTAGASTGIYQIPISQQGIALAPKFLQLLADDNITIVYSKNRSLVESQKTNFAPRFGFAYRIGQRAVVRGGFGLFFGGLESTGYYPNLGENFPFEFDSGFNAPSGCTQGGACPTNGFTLEDGFTNAINEGLFNAIEKPAIRGSDAKAKTPYAEQYNMSVEYGINNSLVATASYVGSVARHLQVFPNPNGQVALTPNGFGGYTDSQGNAGVNPFQPYPHFGGFSYTSYSGVSSYNSLQGKIEKRYSNGLNFLATYTYSHSLDDAPTPLGSTGDSGYRGTNIVPIGSDYSNSPFDVRHRVTLNGTYELPFGKGRKYFNSSTLADYVIGGWRTSLVFRAQTGEAFTVGTNGYTGPSGAGANALLVGNPFRSGGSPTASASTCPSKVKTVNNWYNPCAFSNPNPPAPITYTTQQYPGTNTFIPNSVGGGAALAYLGGVRNSIHGPGYDRVDMSLFKSFPTFREQNLEFRMDAFNLLNTTSWGQPSTANNSATGGLITGARFFQSYTPDSRFFQFALKYNF